MAAAVLAAWFVSTDGSTGIAQDAFQQLPASTEGFGGRPLVASSDDFTDDATGSRWASEPLARTWTQTLANLTRGRTQLEGGYSFLHDSGSGGSGTQHAFPDLLLRYGLTNRLELRVGWPGYVSNDADDPDFGEQYSGTLDPNVGLVFDLWRQRGMLPQAAVLAAVPVRLEGNPFASNSLQPLTELMYAWQTTDRMAITGRWDLRFLMRPGTTTRSFSRASAWMSS